MTKTITSTSDLTRDVLVDMFKDDCEAFDWTIEADRSDNLVTVWRGQPGTPVVSIFVVTACEVDAHGDKQPVHPSQCYLGAPGSTMTAYRTLDGAVAVANEWRQHLCKPSVVISEAAVRQAAFETEQREARENGDRVVLAAIRAIETKRPYTATLQSIVREVARDASPFTSGAIHDEVANALDRLENAGRIYRGDVEQGAPVEWFAKS